MRLSRRRALAAQLELANTINSAQRQTILRQKERIDQLQDKIDRLENKIVMLALEVQHYESRDEISEG